ncbi:MAG: TonB-dependent receptor [bacterium]|nr:TonB-dependent receptor [bacterium]
MNTIKKILPHLLILLVCTTFTTAKEIKGLVKDRKKPIHNVRVLVKNTEMQTFSDEKGKFVLTLPFDFNAPSVILVFDRIGFHPLEKRVTLDDKERTFSLVFLSMEFIQHKIAVTARSHEEKTGVVPMAENVISDLEIHEKLAESVTDVLADTPGVHFIGKGGHTVTPSIRGLARRRVLMMVDGARVTSDRRVGASASFVPPAFSQSIEVVRTSSSVLYGSDAMGGVVNIRTRNKNLDEKNTMNLDFGSVNNRFNTGITYKYTPGNFRVYTAFQYTHAEEYKTPEDKILNSGFTNFSGLMDAAYKNDKREFYLGWLGGFGRDIGKPEVANNRKKFSIVTKDNTSFFRTGYTDKSLLKNGTFNVALFLNPTRYLLDKTDNTRGTWQRSDTESLNLGLKTYMEKSPSKIFSYRLGMEWYSRSKVNVDNTDRTSIEKTDYSPMTDGTRNDYGLFLLVNYKGFRSFEIDAGLRHTFFSIKAKADGVPMDKSTNSTSFFLGVTRKLGKYVSLFFNTGRSFRFPSLSESFYTGITGRKYVRGNPYLKPESSFSIDTGIKISTSRYFLGAYLFSYDIDNMIERYKRKDIYTYANIDSGRISGWELEGRVTPVQQLEFFGHVLYYKGKSLVNDAPLNDVPAPRFFLGGKFYLQRFWFGMEYLHSFKKTEPGPAEVENKAYEVINIKGGWYISSSLFFYLKVSNLLNESYYANPDSDIPMAKGTDFSAGLHFYF